MLMSNWSCQANKDAPRSLLNSSWMVHFYSDHVTALIWESTRLSARTFPCYSARATTSSRSRKRKPATKWRISSIRSYKDKCLAQWTRFWLNIWEKFAISRATTRSFRLTLSRTTKRRYRWKVFLLTSKNCAVDAWLLWASVASSAVINQSSPTVKTCGKLSLLRYRIRRPIQYNAWEVTTICTCKIAAALIYSTLMEATSQALWILTTTNQVVAE